MAWTYEATDPGNVAGMTELVLSDGIARLALGFGTRPEEAGLEACAALAGHFENAWDEYVGNWHGFLRTVSDPPEDVPEEDRALYLTSAAVLRTHADRTVPGAIVASLSIPWGSSRNDLGGYHLVWSRDLVESAGALVALGAGRTARRTLAYLVATQEPDGSWVQNQWVDGVAYWSGLQLDEAAYPILLAGALRRGGAAEMHGMAGSDAQAFEHLLTEDSLEHMIRSAARFIARTGPATGQDRWEEDAGLTPSTLAPVVAALVVAADHSVEPAATYLRELADDWNASIEDWTYARGTRLSREHGVDGHYVRIASPDVLAGAPISTPVAVRNRPPEASTIPADEMVGTDFLALVRFGLRMADDPRILATLAVTDALLRTETPSGPVWHRYSGDGYGEHEDGSAFDGTGIGRAGRCWSASAATTSWRLAATHARTSRRCAGWGQPAGCCPSRSGTRRRSQPAGSLRVGPADPPCRSPGRTPSTSSSCGRSPSATPSTGRQPPGTGTTAWRQRRNAQRGASPHLDRRWSPAACSGWSCSRRRAFAGPPTGGGPGPTSTPATPASGCGSPMSPARTGCRPAGPSTSPSGGPRPSAGRAGTSASPSSRPRRREPLRPRRSSSVPGLPPPRPRLRPPWQRSTSPR